MNLKTLKHRNRCNKLAALVAAGILSLAVSQVSAAGGYSISVLTPNIGSFQSGAINNAGQFVGFAPGSGYDSFAVYSSFTGNSGPAALVPAGLTPDPIFLSGGWGTGINEANQVVGYAWNGVTADYQIAVRWDGATGAATRLDDLGSDFGNAASSINNLGQAVGYAWNGTDYSAVSWDAAGAITDLGTLGGSRGFANDINDAGYIVGSSYTSGDEADHATVWHNGSIMDLGTLGGTSSVANRINNVGQVAGTSSLSPGDDTQHVVIWNLDDTTAPIDLGALPSVYSSISDFNDAGTVVGTIVDPGSLGGNAYSAALWDSNGLTNLNSLLSPEQVAAGWRMFSADGINDHGVIVASAIIPGVSPPFGTTTVILTPVPEPETYAMMLVGLGLIGGVIARRRKNFTG